MRFITALDPNCRVSIVAFSLFVLCLAFPPDRGYAAAGEMTYEAPPVIRASSLLPPEMVAGASFHVDENVPTDGYMAYFTLKSEQGTFEATGQDLLKIRITELPAIQHLESTSKTKEFLKAAGKAAVKPVESAANIVMHPVETVKGIPAGFSRLFDRMAMGAKSIAGAADNPESSGGEKVADTAGRIGDATITAFGFEECRRSLAKGLGVDPYTTNPVLSQKLTDVAWVAFSGKLGVNTVVSVFVPASMIISATSITNDLVYDTPKADLIVKNREKMIAMGASEALADSMLKNKWYSLSVLTSLVTGLESLSGVAGRTNILELAKTAENEGEARFVAAGVQMLNNSGASLKELAIRGTVVGQTREGVLVVPAPVDYLSWTPQIARIATMSELQPYRRVLLLSGDMSAAAREGFTAWGWTISGTAHPSKVSRNMN
jgi:hypothetical protein